MTDSIIIDKKCKNDNCKNHDLPQLKIQNNNNNSSSSSSNNSNNNVNHSNNYSNTGNLFNLESSDVLLSFSPKKIENKINFTLLQTLAKSSLFSCLEKSADK